MKEIKNNSYKNRGMFLEKLINESNQFYLTYNIAVIYKKPTPIQIIKLNNKNKIVEAYFKAASTSDYNGLYLKRYVDFEAKSTKNTTSFPLNNYTKNEYNHLLKIEELGGLSFTIIYFVTFNEFYLYEIRKMKEYLKINKRNSIEYNEIKTNGFLINSKPHIPLDYLEVLDKIIMNY